MHMTLQDVINQAKEKSNGFDAGSYNGFFAIQVTLSDLNQQFYVEIKDGKLSIEPYEYSDRQANLIISSENFIKMINGELNSVFAFTTGKLKVEGDLEKAKEFKAIFV